MKKFAKKALCTFLAVLTCFASVAVGGIGASARVTNGTTYITQADLNSGFIEFGSYPQTRITDEDELIYLLNYQIKHPSESNTKIYPYYSGTGEVGSMKRDDAIMYYTDMTIDGEKYRFVNLIKYRPNHTYREPVLSNAFQNFNGYKAPGEGSSLVYIFKFEPLKWRVLDAKNGVIMCEDIIDSQPFNNTVYRVYTDEIYHYDSKTGAPYYKEHNYSDAAHTHYANDYATSSIRTWLNNDFYNTAFSAADKTAVATSTVDGNSDKVYLLSKSEAEAQYTGTPKGGTDYAQCQGYYGFGRNEWMTRTAKTGTWDGEEVDFGSYVYNIYVTLSPTKDDVYYTSNDTNHVCATYNGVRPVLKLNLHKHNYSYSEKIIYDSTHTSVGYKTCHCVCGAWYQVEIPKKTNHNFVQTSTIPATCTTAGKINYICACGATDSKPIPATGHHYTVTVTTPSTCSVAGSATYTCACGDKYTETLPLAEHTFDGSVCTKCGYDRADDCTCNCHKSGIAKFFFNITVFFQKLFGKNKVCKCGKKH